MDKLLDITIPALVTAILIKVYGDIVPMLINSNIDIFIICGIILTIVPIGLLLYGDYKENL